jgi:hypothetical protein
MAGLDPAIHVLAAARATSKTWITGTSPVMTAFVNSEGLSATAFCVYAVAELI